MPALREQPEVAVAAQYNPDLHETESFRRRSEMDHFVVNQGYSKAFSIYLAGPARAIREI
jgi:hypothetical protein